MQSCSNLFSEWRPWFTPVKRQLPQGLRASLQTQLPSACRLLPDDTDSDLSSVQATVCLCRILVVLHEGTQHRSIKHSWEPETSPCMPADFCDSNSISCHNLISFCISPSRDDLRRQRSHVLTYENNMLLWLGLAAETPLHLLDQLIRGNIREVRHGLATMMGLKRRLRSEIRTADLQSWQWSELVITRSTGFGTLLTAGFLQRNAQQPDENFW